MKKKPQKTRGAGCLILFGALFFVIGAGFAAYGVKLAFDSDRMSAWPTTPAFVISAELKAHRGSKGSVTHEACATYTYEWEGRGYTGDRVALKRGSDNIGSFHENAYRQLDQARQDGEPIDVHVNPAAPSESVIWPQLRMELVAFGLLFVLAFGLPGLGMMIGGVVQGRRQRHMRNAKVERPEEPWAWKKEWADGRIVVTSKNGVIASFGVAIFWNAISLPILFAVPTEMAKGNHAILIGLIFPVIGVGILAGALYMLLKWRKFGETVFEMPRVPGVIGGRLGGVIMTSRDLEPEDGIRLQLACVRRTVSGSGKNSNTRERIVWESRQVLDREILEDDPTRSAIPVVFDIPYDSEPTSDEDPRDRILWRLQASTSEPGIDFSVRMEVPVFRTPESSPEPILEPDPAAPFRRPPDQDAIASESRVRITPDQPGGVEFYFPPARNLGAMIAVTVFAVVWTGAIVLMWTMGAPKVLAIVFALLDILILYGLAVMMTGTWRVTIGKQGAEIERRVMMMGGMKHHAVDQINEIESRPGMQSGDRIFHDIYIVDAEGKSAKAGSSLPSLEEAEWLVDRMRQALGEDWLAARSGDH